MAPYINRYIGLSGIFLFLVTTATFAQTPIIDLLSSELRREMDVLEKQATPVYFLAYKVTENQHIEIESDFGNITAENETSSRILDINLRVGDYNFDNTHIPKNQNRFRNRSQVTSVNLPVENNDQIILQRIWEATDDNYKNAVSTYMNLKSQTDDTIKSQDFSMEGAYEFEEPPAGKIQDIIDREKWAENLREYSSVFNRGKEVIRGHVRMSCTIDRTYYVSSDGSRIIQNHISTVLIVAGIIVSEDGDRIPLEQTYYRERPEDLPPSDTIMLRVKEMVDDLVALRKAPKAEPYTGPAILSARASGVFFHEIFGHRIEGNRLNDEADGQTFKSRIGEHVLNRNLSIYSDPTQQHYKGKYLNGYYKYDDEGIPGQRVLVVEEGILRNFLMSRKPVGDINQSNGHGRAAPGRMPVSRQSNLFITAKKTKTDEQLRALLIRKCLKQGLQYGYFIEEVAGGFTTTDRYRPNAFNITPRKVYRVYVDGRPDELVRGVSLIGTPLVMFSEIDAAGDNSDVFCGICGAESGGVPVSTISPALLVNKIETQKEPEGNIELPVLPKPEPGESRKITNGKNE